MIELADIEAARARIAASVIPTPLVCLYVEGAPGEIYLKLEKLQPVNSFKIRGAMNAVMLASPGDRAKGLPDPDAVVIPHGGGALTGGIASAIKAGGLGLDLVWHSATKYLNGHTDVSAGVLAAADAVVAAAAST